MASGDSSSARPANLMKYSRLMTQWDEQTYGMLGPVQRAVEAWNGAPILHYPEPSVQEVLTTFGPTLKDWWAKDDWVAKVAVAFSDADRGKPTPVKGTGRDYQLAANTAKLVRTTDSALGATGLVDENRATTDYMDLTAADRLAAQAAKAYDPAQLKRVLSQLPYNDPNAAEFVAEFYDKLGAQNILYLAGRLHADSGGLKLLDESLAAATNSPTFSHQIIDDLKARLSVPIEKAPDQVQWSRDHRAFLNLLQHGSYSENWLGMTAYAMWFKADTPPNPVVLEALARNPVAAAHIMQTPQAMAPPHWTDPLGRLLADVRARHALGQNDLDAAAPHLIAAATASAGGTAAAQNRSTLMSWMARGDLDDIPNSMRKAIADTAAQHYDEVAGRPDARQIFQHLTKGHDDIAEQLARVALQKHAAATFPHMRRGQSPVAYMNDVTAWAENEGTYSPALFLALRENGMEEAEDKARDWEWKALAVETAAEAGLAAVPGAGEEEAATTISAKVAAWGKDAGKDAGKGALAKWIEDHVKPDFAGTSLADQTKLANRIKGDQIKQLTTLLYLQGQIGTGGDRPPDEYIESVVRTYVNGYKPGQSEDALWWYRHKLGMSEQQIANLNGALNGYISHEDPDVQQGQKDHG